MKRVAVINGGNYTPIICEALNPKHYEITEWEIIPMVGNYDIVLFFLENIHLEHGIRSLKFIKRKFLKYVAQNPCKWIMFAPQDSQKIRTKGVMKNHNRAILDACRFGFQFKKRFRIWSSFPMQSVLCNRNCILARASSLHDPKTWDARMDEPMVKRQIELSIAYDKINQMPHDLIHHIIELSNKYENTFMFIDDKKHGEWE